MSEDAVTKLSVAGPEPVAEEANDNTKENNTGATNQSSVTEPSTSDGNGTDVNDDDTPIRVAVVGTGLAGLTTAYLLSCWQQQLGGDLNKGNSESSSIAGLSGTRDGHWQSKRITVDVFEREASPALDAASVTLREVNSGNGNGGLNDQPDWLHRVDLPMRSFAGGYYENLRWLYEILGVRYRKHEFLFDFANALSSWSSSSLPWQHKSERFAASAITNEEEKENNNNNNNNNNNDDDDADDGGDCNNGVRCYFGREADDRMRMIQASADAARARSPFALTRAVENGLDLGVALAFWARSKTLLLLNRARIIPPQLRSHRRKEFRQRLAYWRNKLLRGGYIPVAPRAQHATTSEPTQRSQTSWTYFCFPSNLAHLPPLIGATSASPGKAPSLTQGWLSRDLLLLRLAHIIKCFTLLLNYAWFVICVFFVPALPDESLARYLARTHPFSFVPRLPPPLSIFLWQVILVPLAHALLPSTVYAQFFPRNAPGAAVFVTPRVFTTHYLLPLLAGVSTCSHATLLAGPARDVLRYKMLTHGRAHLGVVAGVADVQARLVETCHASGNVRWRFGAEVVSVEPIAAAGREKGQGGVQIHWIDRATAGRNANSSKHEARCGKHNGTDRRRHILTEHFDKVVIATPPNVVGKLFPRLAREMANIPTTRVRCAVVVRCEDDALPATSCDGSLSSSTTRPPLEVVTPPTTGPAAPPPGRFVHDHESRNINSAPERITLRSEPSCGATEAEHHLPCGASVVTCPVTSAAAYSCVPDLMLAPSLTATNANSAAILDATRRSSALLDAPQPGTPSVSTADSSYNDTFPLSPAPSSTVTAVHSPSASPGGKHATRRALSPEPSAVSTEDDRKVPQILHAVEFTRVLRSVQSRRIVNRLFGEDEEEAGENGTAQGKEKTGSVFRAGDAEGVEEHGKKMGKWRSGDDGVYLVGSWCWDGLVLLEGCVVSAMRVAREMGVRVPWESG